MDSRALFPVFLRVPFGKFGHISGAESGENCYKCAVFCIKCSEPKSAFHETHLIWAFFLLLLRAITPKITKKGPKCALRKTGNALTVPFILRQVETIYQMVTVHSSDPEQEAARVRRFSRV